LSSCTHFTRRTVKKEEKRFTSRGGERSVTLSAMTKLYTPNTKNLFFHRLFAKKIFNENYPPIKQ
jgi:hypothetical protein